jgi:serine/threonine-protein kinase RsbW
VLPAAGATQARSLLSPASPASWSHTFAATADQVRLARRGLAAFLNGSPLVPDAITCLSELVTNAIEHSESGKPGGTVTVRALLTDGRLHVAVRDQGGPWQQAHPTSTTGPGGRGLHIVAALADGWGKTAGDGSRTVWFTMTRHEPAQLPRATEET